MFIHERQAANAKKMHAAYKGGGDQGLGPSQMAEAAIKQRGSIASQAATAGSQEAQDAQVVQWPVNAPAAPSGPEGVC
jgi:hypothetical protein